VQNDVNIDPIELAVEFSLFTNRSLFITGKAGTGKTTFLNTLHEYCQKKLLVVAPTGIAAVNAGGVTIHSFFQFPPKVLDDFFFDNSMPAYSQEKRHLIRELDVLVIDEVSMVRADVMEGIDKVLRYYRKNDAVPFGGIQLIMLGDLYQLSPVVGDNDLSIIQKRYASPFFFSATAIKQLHYTLIELTKVFRQSDNNFINLLNAIRQNNCTEEELAVLNSRCLPLEEIYNEYIFLTTHRSTAETTNNNSLRQLIGQMMTINAIVEGEFPEGSDPAPRSLQLKVGARIIFLKNDNSEKKEYFNGKAGIIDEIEEDKLKVKISNNQIVELERATWINRGAKFNTLSSKIEMTELGSFRQFPVRLAWAITIHKSQGMTFEKAVIDASNSFAPGQVYVALSRLKSFDGLILKEPITRGAIKTDPAIVTYHQSFENNHTTISNLNADKISFRHDLLSRLLNFENFCESVQAFIFKNNSLSIANDFTEAVGHLKEISQKFQSEIDVLYTTAEVDRYQLLQARTEQAVNYYLKKISEKLMRPLQQFASKLTELKKNEDLISELNLLYHLIETKSRELKTALQIAIGFRAGADTRDLLQLNAKQHEEVETLVLETKKKEQKGPGQSTQMKTLSFFQKGLPIEEIAMKRKLDKGVIEDHLVSFLKTGEVLLNQLVTADKAHLIVALRKQHPDWSVHEMRLKLGADISFGEIRAVLETL